MDRTSPTTTVIERPCRARRHRRSQCLREIDEQVARRKLDTMGIQIDHADARAVKYLASSEEGT